jgi:hypothetical protein
MAEVTYAGELKRRDGCDLFQNETVVVERFLIPLPNVSRGRFQLDLK